MKEKSRRRVSSFKIFTLSFPLLLIMLFVLFPFVWTFITSIKPEEELYTRYVRYFPNRPTLRNYALLFKTTSFSRYLTNSAIVATSTCLLSLAISTTAGYSFSRFRFWGRDLILMLFLLIHMFPAVLFLIPLFIIMRSLKLLNTYFSLIFAYATFTIPFSVWMLTGFFDALPRELEEAAMVDGCTRAGAFRRVTLPLAAPGLAATAIYIFIYAWNEFLYAVMFTNEPIRTLPVALQTFIGQYLIKWDLLTPGGIITSIPVVVLFILIQKHLIRGLTAGALKG